MKRIIILLIILILLSCNKDIENNNKQIKLKPKKQYTILLFIDKNIYSKQMIDVIDTLNSDLNNLFHIEVLNADSYRDYVNEFNINYTPTMVFLDTNNIYIDKIIGYFSYKVLKNKIKQRTKLKFFFQ